MKFTIEGFSQEVLISMGLDHIDALILQWFSDFQGTGRMKMFHVGQGEPYYWVKYQAVIDDLPSIGINNREVVARRFKKLCKSGVLECVIHKVGGTFTLYKKSNGYANLLGGMDSTVHPGLLRSRPRVDRGVDTNYSSINSSIKHKERFTLSAEEPDEESGPEPDYSALFAEALRPKEAL